MRVGKVHSWACAAVALFATAAASAATINYGNSPLIPPGVTFFNVTESSGTDAVPLYGPPGYFTTGVDFDPTSFTANANGGSSDLTDGQLNFTLAGTVSQSQIVAINEIDLFESGDRTLVGTGTALTQVFAGASISVKVTEIDGIDVPDITLPQGNASVSFNLIANPGILQPWSLGLNIDITTALNNLAVPFTYGATEVEVVINDTLIAISEPSSVAFIAKKDFALDVDGVLTVVPEPTSAGLLALSALGVILRRRSR